MANEEDMAKRAKLGKIYSDVKDCLKKFDDNVISVLNQYFPNHEILDLIEEQKDRLKKRDYHILVAGNWHYRPF